MGAAVSGLVRDPPNPLARAWPYDLRPGFDTHNHHNVSVWKFDPAARRMVQVPAVVAVDPSNGFALAFELNDPAEVAEVGHHIKMHRGPCVHRPYACIRHDRSCLPLVLIEGVDVAVGPVVERI